MSPTTTGNIPAEYVPPQPAYTVTRQELIGQRDYYLAEIQKMQAIVARIDAILARMTAQESGA